MWKGLEEGDLGGSGFHLCVMKYPSWVPYISLKGGKGRDYITYCIRNDIWD